MKPAPETTPCRVPLERVRSVRCTPSRPCNSKPNALFVSVLTFGEIRKGIAKLNAGRRRVRLTAWLETELPSWFEDRILPVDKGVAGEWGRLMARPEKIPVIDGLLAATALRHRLTVVTRNEPGFAATDAALPNPWKE